MLCPERQTLVAGLFKAPLLDGEDDWVQKPDGTRTCSFCGSIHYDDFIDIMYSYAFGFEGFSFSPTSKGYKAYGHRPGVQNASDGGIKFYGWHLPDDKEEKLRFSAVWDMAQAKFQSEYGG